MQFYWVFNSAAKMIQNTGIYQKYSILLRNSLRGLNAIEHRRFAALSNIPCNANKTENKTNDIQPVSFNKEKFDNLIKRCFVYGGSYEIYGGCTGFTVLGPIGASLKNNILQLWRQQFVLKERMFEIDCPSITIPAVFKASGHIDRFTDFVVKDVETKEQFRLDHLIKARLEQLIAKDKTNAIEYEEILRKVSRSVSSRSTNISTFFFLPFSWMGSL